MQKVKRVKFLPAVLQDPQVQASLSNEKTCLWGLKNTSVLQMAELKSKHLTEDAAHLCLCMMALNSLPSLQLPVKLSQRRPWYPSTILWDHSSSFSLAVMSSDWPFTWISEICRARRANSQSYELQRSPFISVRLVLLCSQLVCGFPRQLSPIQFLHKGGIS